MKKYIFLALVIALTTTSCKKFLKEIPRDQVTNATFYATEADIEASVDGIYNAARFEASSGLPIMFPLEQISDDGAYSTNTNFTAERSQMDILTYTSANSIVGGMWSRSYTVINRANNAIKFAVDSGKTGPKVIRLAQAQARFFRAYYHFRLTQIFGDIPLMLEPSDVSLGNTNPSRTTTRLVYESVINDLIYAKANLDSSYTYTGSNGGRATIACAKALLGKVYLTMAGYPLNDPTGNQKAIDELKDLIDNKTRYNIDLNPVFANIFTPIISTKQLDKERIYFIRGTNALANSLQAFTRMGWTFRTFRYTTPSKDFATDASPTRRVYESGDARRNVTVSNFALANFSSSLVSKYNSTNNDDASDDLILLRYADVLMMTAEAQIEIGGITNLNTALATINNVRRTHGGTILPLLTYTDQDDLRTKLRQERRREFAFESMRWLDLKRWNIMIPTIKASLADYYNKPITDYNFIDSINPNKHKVLPIPIQEIANNPNMYQNPDF